MSECTRIIETGNVSCFSIARNLISALVGSFKGDRHMIPVFFYMPLSSDYMATESAIKPSLKSNHH